ncbi:MAG: sulfotransferase, partial [Pseudomonadota bacterium]
QDRARAQLISLFHKGSYLDAAQQAYRWLAQHPEDWEILDLLSASCLADGYVDEAEKILLFCRDRRPRPHHTLGLARVAAARGQNEVSERLLRDLLAENPDLDVAWFSLSGLHKFKPGDPLLIKLRKQVRRKGLTPRQGLHLNLALSKACADLGKWDQAWRAAEAANAAEMPHFDPAAFRRWADDPQGVFDRAFLQETEGRGLPTEAPIFVVGSPRSGTTLVERLLCSTGAAAPMGEVATLNNICVAATNTDREREQDAAISYHRWVRRWRPAAFTEAANLYLSDIARRAGGTCPALFVDKMPGNILHLGGLALMFPRARIVRMHRDPLDTCVSLYMGRFGAGHKYTARLDWAASAWLTYRDAGDFYTGVIPNPVLDLCYEDLVTNPKTETKRLFAFAGLEWSPDVLASGGSAYTSTTRSMSQVHHKVNTSAVGRWRRYRKHLGPLADALGIDLDDLAEEPDTPAATRSRRGARSSSS